jgi:cardiolipin synthase
MALLGWLVAHHVLSVTVAVITASLSAAVLGQRRPTGTAFAWLLVLLFVPYLGIPLYLVFGGRKLARRARSKSQLPREATGDAANPNLTSADEVVWLDDGQKAYEAFLREIRGAKRSIRIVTFVIGDDPTGRALLEAMTERAAAGVEVLLLIDDFLRYHAPASLLRGLEGAGGKVRRFMPLVHVPFRGQGNLRNHRKIALFDGERAIVGGMNLATEYMGPTPEPSRWRDLSTMVSGDVVAPLDAIFRADWEFAAKAPIGSQRVSAERGAGRGAPVRVVPSGPDAPQDAIYDAWMTAIFRAETRFWVATPYFIPDEPLMRALTIAARRGIDVRVVVPFASNHTLADLVAGPSLRELAAEGVKVFRHRGMVHAKTVLVDESLAVVGSANFDMRSLFLDYEVALFFSGAAEVSRLATWFSETLAKTDLGPPLAGWARTRVEYVVRLLAPLL